MQRSTCCDLQLGNAEVCLLKVFNSAASTFATIGGVPNRITEDLEWAILGSLWQQREHPRIAQRPKATVLQRSFLRPAHLARLACLEAERA